MNKKKKILIICSSILGIILISIAIFLGFNKTFYKTKYIGKNGEEIFVPRFSYFKDDEKGMNTATFISLKSKKSLEKEINNYLEEFDYFIDSSSYGYKKDKLIIQSYNVEDKKWYRKIILTYF